MRPETGDRCVWRDSAQLIHGFPGLVVPPKTTEAGGPVTQGWGKLRHFLQRLCRPIQASRIIPSDEVQNATRVVDIVYGSTHRIEPQRTIRICNRRWTITGGGTDHRGMCEGFDTVGIQ